jgi:hypothetical protein
MNPGHVWQGKNSGKFECIGEDLVFKVLTTSSKTGEVVGEKRGFDVSLSSVKNAQVSGQACWSSVQMLIDRNSIQANTTKDEILLEFAQSENSVGRKNECVLVGYIQPSLHYFICVDFILSDGDAILCTELKC